MVPCVFPTPLPIRCESEHTGDKTNDAVGSFGFKERAMTAIVEDDESSNHEQATENSWRNAEPERDVFQEINGNPNGENRNEGVDQLPCGATRVRLLELGDEFFPLPLGRTLPLLGCFLEVFCRMSSHLHHLRHKALLTCASVCHLRKWCFSPHLNTPFKRVLVIAQALAKLRCQKRGHQDFLKGEVCIAR